MGNWFRDLGLFLFAVLAHWQALATGGIVTALVGFIEKKRQKSLSWESYATIMAVFVIYSFFAAWQDEHRNVQAVADQKSILSSNLGSCLNDARVNAAYTKGLEGLNGSQRQTIDRQQQSITSQQGDVSSCVVSLGKMNPIVREKISVIPVLFGTLSAAGHVNDPKGLIVAYLTELFIITNEPEKNFNGDLKCSKDFTFIESPQINPRDTVSTVMRGGTQPKMVSTNEYLVTVESTGTEWNASHPAYMSIRTTEPGIGCTFTPQE